VDERWKEADRHDGERPGTNVCFPSSGFVASYQVLVCGLHDEKTLKVVSIIFRFLRYLSVIGQGCTVPIWFNTNPSFRKKTNR
jgi:hypothetical protein